MATPEPVSDTAAFIRLYGLLQDAGDSGCGDWDLDVALIDELAKDLETASEFAEGDVELERAQKALDAARALHRSLETLAATAKCFSDLEPPA